jgi:hypothetical protein
VIDFMDFQLIFMTERMKAMELQVIAATEGLRKKGIKGSKL